MGLISNRWDWSTDFFYGGLSASSWSNHRLEDHDIVFIQPWSYGNPTSLRKPIFMGCDFHGMCSNGWCGKLTTSKKEKPTRKQWQHQGDVVTCRLLPDAPVWGFFLRLISGGPIDRAPREPIANGQLESHSENLSENSWIPWKIIWGNHSSLRFLLKKPPILVAHPLFGKSAKATQ